MTSTNDHSVLRHPGGPEAKVSFAELFFDLVYVFAVTQLSHTLLHELSLVGAFETLILWFAVWLGWQYTAWVTNWFDPDAVSVRFLLFSMMLLGLGMAIALPEAFGERGLFFAACFCLMQIGRTLYVLAHLGRHHPLTRNFQRIFGWILIASVFWIVGGLVETRWRIGLWAAGVLCTYVSPMFGFWLPGLGRSTSADWRTIDGGLLVERCALFVILALGESILVTGAKLSAAQAWDMPIILAFLVTFAGSLALWWLYFDASMHDGAKLIAHSSDPGRIGAYYHYCHVVLVAGIILAAVGSDLAIDEPFGEVTLPAAAVLVGGPVLYLIGNAFHKRIIYGRFLPSHLLGLAAMAGLFAIAARAEFVVLSALTTLVIIAVAAWDGHGRRAHRQAKSPA